ncbi:MAG: PQQ-dependent sugar dehydrogenase [Planctomycetaceae bacterium]
MQTRTLPLAVVASIALVVSITEHLPAGGPKKDELKPRRAWGIENRVPWTTSQVRGTPDPPDPYTTENAFPHLKFEEPLAMSIVPGTNRLAVAERGGKVWTFDNDAKTTKKELLVDVGRTVYGMVVHPNFTDNGYIFVSSVLDPKETSPTGSRLSRFQVDRSKGGFAADPKTEEVFLIWPSGGHNGGGLRFGPDGFLYLSTGDGSGIADEFHTGQDLGDLLGSILRIDVDHPSDGRPYGIPADNPFVKTAGARPEIFSFGHRQLWRFSFDSQTGQMWGGEVGQDLWEMIYHIQKGGNYGWSVMEGSHPFRPERKHGPGQFVAPLIEHNHNDFRSITGGYVYHGKRLAELRGAYVYGDYDMGRIWSLRYENGKVREHRELADTQIRIVDIGQDSQGEIYFVDFATGILHQLVAAPPASAQQAKFPHQLSETGLFASTKDHAPAPGVVPYSVNAQLYSDNAVKDRFVALPGDSKIEFDAVTYPQPAPGSTPGWRFPDNTVLVKTFSLEMEKGNPASLRRLETRILHHQRMPGNDDEYGAQVWRGYTYLWNDEQTDAELLPAAGLNRKYTIRDASSPGGTREQTWHFPSRAECTLCHTMAAKYVLGVNTLQMNKDHDYGDAIANQLETFDHLGLFTEPLPSHPATLPRLVDYHDASVNLDARVRSYLHANCSHCHRKWGGGNAEFQMLATLPLAQTGTLGVKPGQGQFGLNDPRLLVPGHPERSLIHHRMTLPELGRMPHVASNVVDQPAIELVEEWIRQMHE